MKNEIDKTVYKLYSCDRRGEYGRVDGMRIKSIIVEGFRNFKSDEIRFTDKSLVIGRNDIGKTNLIYALRILLDRSLSDVDIEPKETDRITNTIVRAILCLPWLTEMDC